MSLFAAVNRCVFVQQSLRAMVLDTMQRLSEAMDAKSYEPYLLVEDSVKLQHWHQARKDQVYTLRNAVCPRPCFIASGIQGPFISYRGRLRLQFSRVYVPRVIISIST
jgi:hypothetical protein